MSDIIKPDFEMMATDNEKVVLNGEYNGYIWGCEELWTNHVEPLLSTVKRLQEENRIYKTALVVIRDFGEQDEFDDPGDVATDALIQVDILKSSDLNKEEHGE